MIFVCTPVSAIIRRRKVRLDLQFCIDPKANLLRLHRHLRWLLFASMTLLGVVPGVVRAQPPFGESEAGSPTRLRTNPNDSPVGSSIVNNAIDWLESPFRPAVEPRDIDRRDRPVVRTMYDSSQEVVRLSDPADPIQFQIIEQPVPGGNLTYGAPMPGQFGQPWTWQLLPDGLIYRSYMAGVYEPRMSLVSFYEDDRSQWLLDATIGARVGILRYGTETDIRPDGFQLDLEAAAFPRLDPEEEFDLVSTDFRAGLPITYGNGPYQFKLAYYHLSAHLGDEFLLKNPGFTRINYARDVIVLGTSYYATEDLRLYAEAGWAFYTKGGSEPLEFQFGIDYSPLRPWPGSRGAPFLALNGHLREEVNFGGQFVLQAGWQFRGRYTERLLRTGVHYLSGASPQREFFNDSEEQIGVGLWYDF